MKILFIWLIILQYIEIIFSVIPTWKFDSSTQKLLNPTENFDHEYIVTSGTIWGNQNNGIYDIFVLKRRIYKEEGKVKQENKLYVNGKFFAYTPYDDIESIYRNNNTFRYFVCPKGKFHVYTYTINDGNYWEILKPDNGVNEESSWDLKCYYQCYEDYLFISYLNNEAKFYQYDFYNNYFYHSVNFEQGLYAYSWTTGENIKPAKPMFAIINSNNNVFKFEYLNINVYSKGKNKSYDYFPKMSAKNLTDLKLNKQVYFTKDDVNLAFYYYINYNDENDFETGFNENNIYSLRNNIDYDIGSKKMQHLHLYFMKILQ